MILRIQSAENCVLTDPQIRVYAVQSQIQTYHTNNYLQMFIKTAGCAFSKNERTQMANSEEFFSQTTITWVLPNPVFQ